MADNDNKGGSHPESGQSHDKPVIVTIGASAGGVSALQNFFGSLPERPGAAFVVVVHLDPEHRSELASILSTRTRMPVIQVETREALRADHVYVIPPDRRLQLIDHQVCAEEFEEPRGHRAPIDLFFRSVAERLGDGFAIILSGAGSDGTIGVRAVKEAGGIILVQDPSEAQYASMPRSAIATGVADFVLPVRDLAASSTSSASRPRRRRPTSVASTKSCFDACSLICVSAPVTISPSTSARPCSGASRDACRSRGRRTSRNITR
jgi:two-component system, chemotaxis family, CheB/CheR fusion protein